MNELKGTCDYCGHMNVLPMKTYFSDDEKNKEATHLCNCERAGIERKIKKASQMIKEVFCTDAEGCGFIAISDEQAAILYKAAEAVGKSLLLSVTVCFRNGVKATLKLNGKSEIEIQRTDTSVKKEAVSDEVN